MRFSILATIATTNTGEPWTNEVSTVSGVIQCSPEQLGDELAKRMPEYMRDQPANAKVLSVSHTKID